MNNNTQYFYWKSRLNELRFSMGEKRALEFINSFKTEEDEKCEQMQKLEELTEKLNALKKEVDNANAAAEAERHGAVYRDLSTENPDAARIRKYRKRMQIFEANAKWTCPKKYKGNPRKENYMSKHFDYDWVKYIPDHPVTWCNGEGKGGSDTTYGFNVDIEKDIIYFYIKRPFGVSQKRLEQLADRGEIKIQTIECKLSVIMTAFNMIDKYHNGKIVRHIGYDHEKHSDSPITTEVYKAYLIDNIGHRFVEYDFDLIRHLFKEPLQAYFESAE